MKKLIVLRGLPGSGKSTFVKEWGLEPYTVSPDAVRILMESPVMDDRNGRMCISQESNREVWKMCYLMLEGRMKRGEFCVVDATHTRREDFDRYVPLIMKYGYDGFCVDFSSVSLQTCMERNRNRRDHKRVPDHVLTDMYGNLSISKVHKMFRTVMFDDVEGMSDIIERDDVPVDVNRYSEVVVFGDVHGCCADVERYFELHPFSDDRLYVFTGDYIDRGPDSRGVVLWLLRNYARKNVVLLRGNHERWLSEWSNGEYDDELGKGVMDRCLSKEFFFNTSPQLSSVSKKAVRKMCRSMIPYFYFTFDGKRFITSHAGVGFMPDRIALVKEDTFVRGNGKYGDPVDQWFDEHEAERNPDLYQIHAHRNVTLMPIHPVKHSYNLCGDVERGGELRVLEIRKGE